MTSLMSIEAQKRTMPIFIHLTGQAESIRNLLDGQKEDFFLVEPTWKIPHHIK